MRLAPGCPRCPAKISGAGSSWRCPTHGEVVPLWRPVQPGYAAFADHLALCSPLPTWLPWPLPVQWRVDDFGCVARAVARGVGGGVTQGPSPASAPPATRGSAAPCAAYVSLTGPSDPDGVVRLTLVTEEPGVGLASRLADAAFTDPGPDVGDGPPLARVRVDTGTVPVWPVPGTEGAGVLDRLVLAGETGGRWLWLLLQPATAVLLLNELGALTDAATLGPQLVSVPFADRRPPR